MPGSEQKPPGWNGWPGGKKFALVLTHDVEGRRGLEKCRLLAELEKEMGFRSSFNFVPEGDYRVSSELRTELVRSGFEVGVHDLRHDGRLYQSRRDFDQNARRINEYLTAWGAAGFRSGFMLHNLNWLHELDIKYDMSTFDTDPFEPQPEGRHTIFPFVVPRPQGTNGDSAEGYVELPYTLPQDSTLFVLLREKTPEIWLRKLDWVAANGGMVLLNTHPDYMTFGQQKRGSMHYPVSLYRELLQYVRANYPESYWHALPHEVADFVCRDEISAGRVRDNRRDATEISPATSKLLPEGVSRRLRGKRGAVLLFSHYPADPRPRRAAEALIQQGAEVDLICLQERAGEPRREKVNGVNVLRVPLRRRRGGKVSYAGQYSAFILTAFGYLTVRALTRRYDFVHVHNMPDALVFSALVPKMLGAKIILDLHDPMPELMRTIFGLSEESLGVRALKKMEKSSIAFSNVVLTVNQACKRIYSSRSCSPEKIRIVLNSPDEAIFKLTTPAASNGHEPNPFRVLYHGSLVSRNGFDLAVDAIEIVRAAIPQIKLIVCGTATPFFEEVMKSASARGLQGQIEYLGAQNLSGIVAAINRSHLGIIPNHRNIFTEINTPTRIFEYLALGKPVIAPRAPGIQDYFGDGDLIYFELGDARDLARQIEFAYLHPKEVEQVVRRGQQIYCGHTWSRERATLLNAVADVL